MSSNTQTMRKNIPNILTLFRIIMIPILITSFYLYKKTLSLRYISTFIFAFASITDYFDGMLARRWSVQSNFGRMLDPIADKLLVLCTLFMMIRFKLAPTIPVLIILCREVFISGLREFLATSKAVSIPVTFLAKVKTTVQMTAILLLLLGNEGTGLFFVDRLGVIMIWIAALLTVITGIDYLRAGIKNLKKIK